MKDAGKNKKWTIKPRISKDIKSRFPEYPEIVLQLLYNRGVIGQSVSKEQIENFLNPSYEDHLHDPFLFSGMKKAVDLIIDTINKKEKIVVYGDYDVDGVSATALLFEVLNNFGAKVSFYIPKREDEGYGLNIKACEKLVKEKIKLLIAVDCGIISFDEVDFLEKKKITVVICDHHEPKKDLPKASAILNPKVKGEKYPFSDLAAVGVAFKLACALIQSKSQKPKAKSQSEKWLLDLVALGTICDIVPLVDENRVLAKYGLIVLSKSKRAGLKALYRVAGISQDSIDTYNVGFQIGPRLNASGRMDDALMSLKLLLTKDTKEASTLAHQLNDLNTKRQKLTNDIYEEAKEKIEKKEKDSSIIIIKNKGWNHGVVGIVASKLMEDFLKPVIILEEKGSGLKGSARSVNGFDITKALGKCSQFLDKYGGHEKAAGLLIKKVNFGLFKREMIKIVKRESHKIDQAQKIVGDCFLSFDEINEDFWEYLKQFHPFGSSNKKPYFISEEISVVDAKNVGKNKDHLKLCLKKGKKYFSAIGFGLGNGKEKVDAFEEIDVFFSIEENIYNNTKNLELKIVDIRSKNE